MKHFIFDCDDVLLDWQSGFAEFLSKYYGIIVDPVGPPEWCLSHWIGVSPSDSRRLVLEFNASVHFGGLKACAYAKEVVWTLKGAGHGVSLVSACGTEFDVRKSRMTNLFGEFSKPKIGGYYHAFEPVHLLSLGSSKFDYLYNFTRNHYPGEVVFVEDNYTHARAGVANGIKSYCLRRSHNRGEEAANPGSGVIWIEDIRQVLEAA